MFRLAQHDEDVDKEKCHPERSEGSHETRKIFCRAQDDICKQSNILLQNISLNLRKYSPQAIP